MNKLILCTATVLLVLFVQGSEKNDFSQLHLRKAKSGQVEQSLARCKPKTKKTYGTHFSLDYTFEVKASAVCTSVQFRGATLNAKIRKVLG